MSELQRVKVIEIFFEEDPTKKGFLQIIPSFLLENGEIKRGVIINKNQVLWITDKEYDELKNKRIISPDFIKIDRLHPRDEQDRREIEDKIKRGK